MTKKGQAAMEFLMTYGWAILAAIIAIGVLAYMGVFSPGQYTSGSAIVTAPFYANAHNVKTTGVTLELKNNGGETLTLANVSVSGCGSDAPAADVAAGALQAVTVACTLTEGASFTGNIAVTYTKAGSTVELSSTGTVSDKVIL